MSVRHAARVLIVALVVGGLARARADQTDSQADRRVDVLAVSPERLSGWSAMLQDERPERWAAGVEQLRSLGAEALPALSIHLRELARAGADGRSLAPKLAQLRRLQRGREALPAASLASALTDDRSTAMRHAVELVSLQQALIAQHTPAAAEALVGDLFRLAPNALRSDAVRARKQLGSLLGPAYLRHAASPDAAMRRLCRAALAALGMSTPRQAFQHVDATALPPLLRVYGELRSGEALPWIAAYLGDARPAVHAAAREALVRYGSRATTLLRERFLRLAHAPAPPEWDVPRLAREIEERVFLASEEAALRSIITAEAALAAGKLADAERALDLALQAPRRPPLDERIASTYLTLGRRYQAASQAFPALRAYRRALRSRLPAQLTSVAQARVLQLEAELRLSNGIADVHALSTAAALDPTLTRASDLLHELSGARAAEEIGRRRWAGAAGSLLLALAAALLLRDAKHRRARPRLPRNLYR